MADNEFKNLFNEFNKFLQQRRKKIEEIQKKAQNDYNILSITHKNSDELMHSKMLASLLDINGLHYQEDLFLKKFLTIVNIEDFNTKNAIVKTEKSGNDIEEGRIDIYITDGNKHIVIENKINAEDQKEQLKRYVNIIKSENEEIEYENIIVIYLSKNRQKPENLEKYYLLENNILKDKKTKTPEAIYKPIHYKNEILKWLDECLKEVYNISNLREAIITYKQVVEKIIGEYQKKGIPMSNFLIENPDCIKYAYELNKNFSNMMGKVIFEFLKTLDEYTLNKHKLENVNDKIDKKYVYDLKKCQKWFKQSSKDRKNIGSFFRLNDDFLLFFVFGESFFHVGFRQYKKTENTITFIETKKFDNLPIKNIEFRNYKTWNGYSIRYGDFLNNYNPNLQECIESETCQIKKDIDKIINFFKER